MGSGQAQAFHLKTRPGQAPHLFAGTPRTWGTVGGQDQASPTAWKPGWTSPGPYHVFSLAEFARQAI